MANGRIWFLILGILLVVIIGLPLVRKFISTKANELTETKSESDFVTLLTAV
jgi:hypothetical protein